MQSLPPDFPAYEPPTDTHRYMLDMMRAALPAPDVDTPEALAERDRRAMVEVAAMAPEGVNELILATTAVVAAATAIDCLRLAVQHLDDPKLFGQLNRQSKAMQRESRAQRKMLLRLQAARLKQQAPARGVAKRGASKRRASGRAGRRAAP